MQQRMRRSTKRAPGTGGGGGRNLPTFVDRYIPPLDSAPDMIRILRGEYPEPVIDPDARDFAIDETGKPLVDIVPYYKYVEYFHGTKKRGCIGSEGPLGAYKGKGDPCIAADWYWYEWRERQRTGSKNPNAMSRREKWALSVLVLAPFYKVPRTDQQGNLVVNPNTKEAYYDWAKGSRRANNEYEAAGYEKKQGHAMHMSLGYGQWNSLLEFQDTLGRHCRSCNTQDTIEEEAWLCRNCGEAVIEMATTRLEDAQIKEMTQDEVTCPHCRHHGFLEELIHCRNCSKGSRATLFDFDLEIQRVKVGSGDSKNTQLQITRAIGPKPIDATYPEEVRRPLDLVARFAPTPLDKQRELFGTPPSDEEEETPVQRTPYNGGRPAQSRQQTVESAPEEEETEERAPVTTTASSTRRTPSSSPATSARPKRRFI